MRRASGQQKDNYHKVKAGSTRYKEPSLKLALLSDTMRILEKTKPGCTYNGKSRQRKKITAQGAVEQSLESAKHIEHGMTIWNRKIVDHTAIEVDKQNKLRNLLAEGCKKVSTYKKENLQFNCFEHKYHCCNK
jgi:hypothetical protein